MKITNLIVSLSLLICLCNSCSNQKSSAMIVDIKETKSSTRLFRIFKNRKFGFIDSKGKIVIEPKYDDVQDFSEDLALVSLNGKKIFIDRTGKIVIEPKDFEPINGFTNGLARGNITTKSPYTKGYIDKSGKVVIDNPSIWGACEFSEGLACVVAGKWGFIDTSGQYVIKPQFDQVVPFSEGFAVVSYANKSKTFHHKSGYIDKAGKIVINPDYDVAQSFSEGLAAVGMEIREDVYQWGYIDKTGTMIIKPQFEWTYGFREGFAAVQVSDKWGFINKDGSMIIKPLFDKAEHFSEGLAAVAINGKWGYIDKTGKFIIEPQFNEAMPFIEGIAFVKINGYDAKAIIDVVGSFDEEGKWGYIDKTGKYIWQPTN